MNLESLESRRLLSVSVTLDSNGLLTVTGTKNNDVVDLASEKTYLKVLNAFGQEQDVDFSKVKAVYVNMMGGNDTFIMNDKILVPMTIIGGSGNDSLRGGGGDDLLIGGGGDDSLCGGAGFDTADFSDLTTGVTFNMADATIEAVVGSQGNDSIIGSDGNDIILGEGGNDTLIGNGGDDYIDGGVGEDSMSGGAGDDIFLNYDGQPDTLDGGSGHNFAEQDSNDTFINIDQIFDQNPSGNNGGGSNSGGSNSGGTNSGGSNSGGTAGNSQAIMQPAADVAQVQHAALALAIVADPVATLERGVLSVTGTSGADSISVILDSTGKNIDVTVNSASETFPLASVTSISIDAAGGNDSVALQRGDGSRAVPVPADILGSNGNDTIVGGAGDDTITGGNGNDVISGMAGNDSLQGADGNDTVMGGDGNDYLNGGTSASTGPDGADVISGGAGNDTVLYISRTDNISVNLNDNKPDDGAPGEGDNVETDVENILSGTGNDTLTGNASANVLSGNAGSDIIKGGGGHDKIIGGAGVDTLSNTGPDATVFSLTDLGRDDFSSALNGSGLPTSDLISGDVGLDFSTTSGEVLG